MIAKTLIPLIAVTLFALPAHAHDCSGGTNGGMDATGNQCNDIAAPATAHPSGDARTAAAPPAAAEPAKVASRGKATTKRNSGTRHTSLRSPVKHG